MTFQLPCPPSSSSFQSHSLPSFFCHFSFLFSLSLQTSSFSVKRVRDTCALRYIYPLLHSFQDLSKFHSSLPMLVRNFRFSVAIFLLSFFPGSMLCAVVSLSSIEIFKTHEWLKATPTVYFLCKGESKKVFPDVKKDHVFYGFNGEESWQPLTNFSSKKCKRCGFYEEDSIVSDDVFDEWEFCPSDFTALDGKYIRFKEKEFNATFRCLECISLPGVSSLSGEHGGKALHVAVVVLLCALLSTILALGVVATFKFWQKKRREQDQARFLKLFEDGDDIDDELGLG